MASCQFWGKESLLHAFRNLQVEAWAIFEGKRLLVKNMGEDTLETMLDALEESSMSEVSSTGRTNTLYTLKVYEDIKDRKQIKEKTECDGSYNFRLLDNETYQEKRVGSPGYQVYTHNRETLLSEIKGLRQDVALLQSKQEDEPERKNKLGFIGELIESPIGDAVLPHLGAVIASWLSKGNVQYQPQQLAGIGSIPQPGTTTINGDTADIVAELMKHDPNLKAHLEKLLNMAIHDPASFQFLLGTLDKL